MNVCVLDAARICVGCGRTLDEIARWGGMSAAEQWQVVDRLEQMRQLRQDATTRGSSGSTVSRATG
jgi:predicted Fe-S protein YdhL (DUF1289 family)